IDLDRGADRISTQQEVLGEDVLDVVLDGPLQRPGAEGRVAAELDQLVLRRLGHLEEHALRLELVAHPLQLDVYDLADLLDRQAAEDDRRVYAVQELGPEAVL